VALIEGSIQNPKSAIQNRKGIYQAFDAQGNITADERWRFMRTVSGGIRIDNETIRIAPFEEPRNESLTLELGPGLEQRLLAIHALNNRRESRARFMAGQADFCWRLDEHSQTREMSWRADCEIDYNSPLFNMVTLWRVKQRLGQPHAFDVAFLDDVTFEPHWMRQVYTFAGHEPRETRFGVLTLGHYLLDFGGDGNHISHFWCDRDGIVFDFASSFGGGFRLVAVNFPASS
jgi:hypothetical protein